MLDKMKQEEEEKEKAKQPKLKFPLLKNDNELDELLTDMLGPEQAKKIMYGSDHASHQVDQSDQAYSRRGGDDHMGEHLQETDK